MRKIFVTLAVVTMALLVMVGCSSGAEATYVDFSLAVEGASSATEFTQEDAKKLTFATLESSITNQMEETTDYSFGGVLLTDVLEALEISDYEVITIEATDGYQVNYDKVMIAQQDIILAWLNNGEAIEDGAIFVAPAEATGKTLAKYAAKIIVVE